MRRRKTSSGFTLMEAVIALGIWAILAVSALFIWQHVSARTNALLARQNAFENARGSMDILIANIQMAKTITLNVGQDYLLTRLYLSSYNPDNNPHTYRFDFINDPRSIRHQRLEFGQNELASNIALVRLQPIGGQYMRITIRTNCDIPIVLEGSVDIRHKTLTLNGVPQ